MALAPSDLAALIHFFEHEIPFNTWLGIRVVTLEPGRAVVTVPFRRELVGDPTRPALHGGVLSALVDTAGGLAAFAMLDNPAIDRVSTVDLGVSYLAAALLGDLVCEGTVVRMGNRIAHAHMTVRQGEHVPVVARGVYNVVRRA